MSVKKSRQRRVTALVAISILEVVFRASATLVAQPLKRDVAGDGFVLSIPMFHLLLETSTFPVPVLIWIGVSLYKFGRIRVQNWRYRMRMYLLMAVLDCISCFAASIGLNIVPATIFTILGSAAIVFSLILTKAFTKKKFTPYHVAAVVLTFVSVCLLFSKSATGQDQIKIESTDSGVSDLPQQSVSFTVAMLCCLLSSFLIASIGVLNYLFFVHENLKYDVTAILENIAIQSLFVAIILLPIISTSSEVATWGSVFNRIHKVGNPWLFVNVCIGIWLSRIINLFSSVATTAFASALLARALGGPRRVLVISISWLVFNEGMPVFKVISGLLMCVSTAVYVYGGHKLQQQQDKKLFDSELKSTVTKT